MGISSSYFKNLKNAEETRLRRYHGHILKVVTGALIPIVVQKQEAKKEKEEGKKESF